MNVLNKFLLLILFLLIPLLLFSENSDIFIRYKIEYPGIEGEEIFAVKGNKTYLYHEYHDTVDKNRKPLKELKVYDEKTFLLVDVDEKIAYLQKRPDTLDFKNLNFKRNDVELKDLLVVAKFFKEHNVAELKGYEDILGKKCKHFHIQGYDIYMWNGVPLKVYNKEESDLKEAVLIQIGDEITDQFIEESMQGLQYINALHLK